MEVGLLVGMGSICGNSHGDRLAVSVGPEMRSANNVPHSSRENEAARGAQQPVETLRSGRFFTR